MQSPRLNCNQYTANCIRIMDKDTFWPYNVLGGFVIILGNDKYDAHCIGGENTIFYSRIKQSCRLYYADERE